MNILLLNMLFNSSKRVAVLGASGMIGSMLVDYLSQYFKVVATTRRPDYVRQMPNVQWRDLDIFEPDPMGIESVICDCQWAINAIGLIKQNIDDRNAVEAIKANVLFPYKLASVAEQCGCQVIQIATDCVYGGTKLQSVEEEKHDATDVYGKTKSLGEVNSPNMHHLRCSVIGHELKTHKSLMDWFLGQPKGASVSGYANHMWNGITTLHFAKICKGIIEVNLQLPHLQHVVPLDAVSKASLLRYLATEFGREDIYINEVYAEPSVFRTLDTSNPTLNQQLWGLAGYTEPPFIQDMVKELAGYKTS